MLQYVYARRKVVCLECASCFRFRCTENSNRFETRRVREGLICILNFNARHDNGYSNFNEQFIM